MGLTPVFRATRQSSVSFAADRRHAGADQPVRITLTRADGRAVGVGSLRAGTSEARVIWDHTDAQHPGFKVDLTAIPARRQFSAYFGRHGDGDRGWASTSGEYSRSQNRDGFVGRLFALHADERRLAAFNELLREVTGRALSWSIDLGAQQQYFLRFTDSDGGSHTSDGLGDGLISLLFILDALHDSTVQSLIVIDEPELSLHPQFVVRLGKVLARYARDRQIVFATHSPSLVDWTWIAAGARIARIYKRAGRSRVAQPLATTIQSIADAHLTNTHNPHVFGPVGNEVFFQEDGLLVLEGQEDVIYLPIVLREVQTELHAEVFGWGAGGASRARAVLQLFSELHFDNVAVLLDGDAATQKIAVELRASYPAYHVETHPADDIRTKSRRNAQPEKEGLLQADNRALRPEHVDETRDLFVRINEYFAGKSA